MIEKPREAHRVLSIIEVLIQILRSLRKPDLAAAALVCRTWSDVALDLLWEELESVHPIMALLGPISQQVGGWDWDHGFPSGDWARFASYVKRVRSLSYGSASERDGNSDQISYHAPAKWHSYVSSNDERYLLPQIRKIDWNCFNYSQLEMIFPFVSPKIKDIRIRTRWGVSSTVLDRFLRALRRLPTSGVRVLHFKHDIVPKDGVPEEMKYLLESMDDLEELRVPYHLMEPAMFKPSRLRVLEASHDLESGIDFNALLSQLADTCPLLENLRIMFLMDGNINFSVIRPLTRCPKLRSLDMEYHGTFDLNVAEIHEMGRAWRELEVLHIASRRVYNWPVGPGPAVPISLLAAFAEFFSPKLRKLGLYINTQDIPAPPDPPVSFPNLEVLYVGTSRLDSDKAKVAKAFAFLSGLLPKEMGIITSDRWSWNRQLSVFDPGSWGWGGTSWNVLSRMLSQGETEDILAGLGTV
ncbi:hypothetical protein M407DRAFT_19269 [Tulasnella calospora MUT 4182]|uniref:F-box domain-containing protein n=1 Tax=Tulasnella calospora MUT 4182 TaxID=1051891 RepID=A0A0C3QIB4_9AGAM|nr:hypothetical protein M407DRAFT_19269 [Tulasnella calospora MUT 4182]